MNHVISIKNLEDTHLDEKLRKDAEAYIRRHKLKKTYHLNL
jgi:hypothetical protein